MVRHKTVDSAGMNEGGSRMECREVLALLGAACMPGVAAGHKRNRPQEAP